jgi:hypothetical protein
MEEDFSDIRYYGEEDLNEVIARLLEEPTIYRIGRFVLGQVSEDDIKKELLSYKHVKAFQIDFILQIIKKIIAKSTDGLTSEGAGNYSHSTSDKYMFITNHRNIVLDASFINHELFEAYNDDFESTAIAIGNNLLGIPWVKDMARLNKSFVVIRDASVQQMLENSKKLSRYIRKLITESISSVWIAQKEGRAKDGNDFTQPGLLKMFQMSGGGNFVEDYGSLHMVPVAISYEYDPCIADKVKEQIAIENEGAYVKGPMDDFNSMYNGLMGYKGRVHLSYGPEITPEILATLDGDIPKNEKIKHLAEYIDDFIHSNYRLWPNNYIAADMINSDAQFESFYSADEKVSFENYMNEKLSPLGDENKEQQISIFLKMHAYPVRNAYKNNTDFRFNF